VNLTQLSREDLMEAISAGVYRAVWQMITYGTQMPCRDFFDAIEDGIKRAALEIHSGAE
jgi:hypothetical protein